MEITDHLGGEGYRERVRGPPNEGSLYAERQGYHLPEPPASEWKNTKLTDGIQAAGADLYSATSNLGLPAVYDISLASEYMNPSVNSTGVSNIRSRLYVNDYQSSKYSESSLGSYVSNTQTLWLYG